MQGQGSSSNSFQGNFYFNGNPGANQQNVVPNINVSSIHNGQGQNSSMRWIGESSSSLNHTRNHVSNSHQFSGDDLWLSSPSNQSGIGQRFEERHFLDNIGRSNQIGPSNLAGQASSSANNLHRNLDLNAAHDDHHGGGIDQDNGPQLSLGLSRAAGDQVPVSGGSSSASAPVMIYSGIAEYVVEENIGGEGLPSDGRRRLLCKRRAPEIPRAGESSRPSSSVQQPAAAIPSSLNAANYSSLSNRLHGSNNSSGFVSAQAPTPSSFQQIINQNGTGQMDNFERNIRMRRTLMGTQQNTTPANMWSWNSTNSNVQVQTQITSFARFPNTYSAPAPAPAPAMAQPMAHFSSLQPSQWNNNGTSAMTSSWAGLSDNLREALIQEQSLRDYYRRNTMSNHHLTNMQDQHLNLANGNYTNNFGNNIASSSRSTQLPSSSVRNQLVQRLQHLVNEGISHCPIHSGSASSSAARDMEVSVRGGNARPAQRLAGTRAERQGGGHHFENPSQTASQRRSRLVAEVRNALGLVRRGGAFRLEDVMVIDRSFLYGLPELGDTHDAMRLDVDNMSYEEDYANGEELGKLDCGHDFHFSCIKQWLVQKNSCPICKKTALAI
ncbi:Zinc finger, RING-type [Corchorus olitorius]|uniref:RING-type E3 ubiquitin transferase n=1 Tax=Corchorus olitorius TaxID=93759 RepID=A0A1R3K4J3_9ROSI|nr:Zinc finger, RING-type [Corchorus olitorius]